MRKILECCNCPTRIIIKLTKPTYDDIKLAIYRLEIDRVKDLLHQGAPTHDKGENILHFAVSQNKLEAVEFICENYFELIDERNDSGDTPLMLALFGGHHKLIDLLLNLSNLGLWDNNGNTAFIIAAANGNLSALAVMLRNPCINALVKNFEGQTALHRAAFYGQLETIKFLLKTTKLKLLFTDKNENNSLHMACLGGNLVCIRYILNKVKEPEKLLKAVNKDDQTPMEVLEDAVSKVNSMRKFEKKIVEMEDIIDYIFQNLDPDLKQYCRKEETAHMKAH